MALDLLAIKECKKCGESKELSDFRFNMGYYENVCKVCRNKSRKKPVWRDIPSVYAKHKFVEQAKLSAGCQDCGYKEHAAALQYDHIDSSSKLISIASCTGRSWSILIAEMNKCRVLCANCHSIHHYGERYES